MTKRAVAILSRRARLLLWRVGSAAAAAALLLLATAQVVAAAVTSAPPARGDHRQLAFPGAEGYGKYTQGGRGGRIIAVTTLADSGPGSLRACIDATGPRVCIFHVGGVIRFTTTRPIISHPYITIAGQTAPGGGILLTHNGGDGLTPLVIKNTHDVIVRYVRIRPDKRAKSREANDAITVENASNVVLDHVSGSWALDENMNTWGPTDHVTISWSIFAEGIPRHDKCALLANKGPESIHISFIKNICAHNGDRNPDINYSPTSCVEVINNVLYNANSEFTEVWATFGGTPANVIGNYYKAGPDTTSHAYGILRQTIGAHGVARIYAKGNYFGRKVHPLLPGTSAVLQSKPVCPLQTSVLSAQKAYAEVTAHAGALPRDAFDQKIVWDVLNRKGKIVHKAGPLPPIAHGTAPKDSDGDGMPDDWEKAHGSNPNVYDPWADADGNGWSNLDDYLNDLSNRLVASSSSGTKL